ncbi:MAG TPA: alpha/beta hydrolase [Woeseiaceae bacterium]|nr:alpha/beta hydrolase [Woeseiaceae bacterium]
MSKIQRVLKFVFVAFISMSGVMHWNSAAAQDASRYYTVMHPEEFEIDWGAFYEEAERRTANVREQLPHHLDLAYGEDPKQRLDLYLPEGEVEGAPVFLFLHGGGFREGDRAQYGFVAEPFAARGIITAVASYRLTGDGHHYPAQPQDAKAAVEWLYRKVAQYGGDPEALYVGGHSAGAILAADLGVDRAWLEERGIPQSVLRGIAPISGSYDLRGAEREYTPTPKAEVSASPLLQIEAPVPAAVVAVGSVEEKYLASSRELVERLERAGASAELVVAEGEDHRDTVVSLGDADSRVFREILAMIRPAG